jgi:predicted transcriptional regulator
MPVPTSNDLLHEIMRTLGRVENGLDRIRDDFQEEKESAHESRAVIHRRLDEQATQISKTETTIAIRGQVEAQVRDEIRSLKATVEKNHEEVVPSIAEWRRIKILGAGFGGILLLLGISVGAIVTWASDTASSIVRQWLKLP